MDIKRTDEFLKDHGCTTWGDFNNPPLPYKECDISHFWEKFSHYGMRDVEFRQVKLNKRYLENVHILVYSDKILMLKVNFKLEDGKNVYFPTCYIVGCNHEFDIQVNVRGFGKRTCKICGYWENWDCSD